MEFEILRAVRRLSLEHWLAVNAVIEQSLLQLGLPPWAVRVRCALPEIHAYDEGKRIRLEHMDEYEMEVIPLSELPAALHICSAMIQLARMMIPQGRPE